MSELRILVADDEPTVALFLRKIIKDHVLPVEEILEASNGSQAAKIAARERPDLILLDIRMPVMDGLEAAELILEDNPDAFIVMVTAYDDFELVRRALLGGVGDYLVKPVLPDAMSEIIKRALARKQKGAPIGNARRAFASRHSVHEYGNRREATLEERLPGQPYLPGHALKHPLVATVEKYVREKLESPLKLENIADACCLSPSHCSRQFRKLAGVSLTEFIAREREYKAKELLTSSHENITEIADVTGFDNSAYFSAWFRKRTGQTPMQFRKTARE